MVKNKKVKNARVVEYNGIVFKSKLESEVYQQLVQAGFDPQYEKRTFILWKGFRPTVPFYTRRNRKSKENKLSISKLIDIRYTPDFTFIYNKRLVIVEVKGKENDTYPIKRKLFRRTLEDLPESPLFFEVFSKDQLLEAIQIIKSYGVIEDREDTKITGESPREGYTARREISEE